MSTTVGLSPNYFPYLFLVIVRIGALLMTVPVFNSRSVPPMVKIGLALFLAIIITPSAPSAEKIPTDVLPYALAIGREALVGSLTGFATSLLFSAVQAAADLVGIQAGFSLANVINPLLSNQGSILDQLYSMLAIVVFLDINGHHQLLLAIQGTLDTIPVNTFGFRDIIPSRLMDLSAAMILSAVRIALPVTASLMLTDMALALVARVAPQMNVFAMGMPVKIGVAVLGLVVTLPFLVTALDGLFGGLARDVKLILG